MGIRHGIWTAGLLLLVSGCGDDDDAPPGGRGQTGRAAEALARAMHFTGGELRDGAMGLATEDQVEALLPEDQVVRPGRAGIMPIDVDNPIEDDKPARATLMQFGEVEQHVRVPNKSSVEGTGDLNFEFEIDADACKGLCAERIEVPVTIALELTGGDISKHSKTTIVIDCRKDGDPDACEDEPSGGDRDAGSSGAGGSGGRDGSVPVDPGATAAVQDLLDAVEDYETEVCMCLPSGDAGDCLDGSSSGRTCYEVVLSAFVRGNEDLIACMQTHFEARLDCVSQSACDETELLACVGEDEDNWAAIEEHCGDVPAPIRTGIDACGGDAELMCANGDPYPVDARCDDVEDCADGTDELGCGVPTNPDQRPDSFPCTNGTQLTLDRVCDGAMDCPGGLDEMVCAPCSDGSGQFSGFDVCDGEKDCADGSDELSCMFPCGNGQMVMIQKYCDGTVDCSNGADEAVCMSGVFTCIDGEEVALTAICDGAEDCSSGEDEQPPYCD